MTVQMDLMLGLSAIEAVIFAVRLPEVVLYAVTVPFWSTFRMLSSLLVQMSWGGVSVFLKVGVKVRCSPLRMVAVEMPRETVTFFFGN